MAEAEPSPDVEQVARNRAGLREQLKTLEQNRSQLTGLDSHGLVDHCKAANAHFETLTRTDARSTALDAKVMSTIGHLGAEQCGNLDKAGEAYVRMLKSRFGLSGDRDGLNWKKLSNAISEANIYMHVPAVVFVLGHGGAQQAAAPKVRKERARKERPVIEELKVANAVSASQLQETAEAKSQNARMLTLLKTIKGAAAKGGGKVNLFELLLHPTSFSQTVENFFDLAFLVKDGRAAIKPAKDAAFVEIGKPPETSDFEAGLVKHQNIIRLDYSTYQSLVQRWCKGPPMLDRDEGEEPAAKAPRMR